MRSAAAAEGVDKVEGVREYRRWRAASTCTREPSGKRAATSAKVGCAVGGCEPEFEFERAGVETGFVGGVGLGILMGDTRTGAMRGVDGAEADAGWESRRRRSTTSCCRVSTVR